MKRFGIIMAGVMMFFATQATSMARAESRAVGAKDYALLYQLTDSSIESLSKAHLVIADLDHGASGAPITKEVVQTLGATGTQVIIYVSIGEAEGYRSYWKKNGYDKKRPTFLLSENPNWAENFKVKFWDKEWQGIVFDMIGQAAHSGAMGVYLDIVDGYEDDEVQAAYEVDRAAGKAPHHLNVRQAMEEFVIAIAAYAKSINPPMKTFPQNAVGLLTVDGDGQVPNERYLNAIGGIGVEDTWTADNNSIDWTAWSLNNLRHLTARKKPVLSTDYPTKESLQKSFIKNATSQGFIPFVGTRKLGRAVPEINKSIPKRLGW